MNTKANFDSQLAKVFTASRYAERLANNDPSLIDDLRRSAAAKIGLEALSNIADALETCTSEAELHRALRKARQRVMLRLIFRDIVELADLDEVVTTTSAFADLALRAACRFHQSAVARDFGLSEAARADALAEMVIVGMGKLGARELNVSSDIDLVFVHAADGDATADRSWHQFHADLGKRIIRAIDDVTEDGFVFRVDMRLRPYGTSGALVTSFNALDEYFRAQGRPWERYAWLKARAITGGDASVTALNARVAPFVYRRYHDYAAIEEMRELHAQIRTEATKRNRLNDIKVGPGGIREIEFVVQMHQLIRGGRETRLQIASTRSAMQEIVSLGLLDGARMAALRDAYTFLRNLEHRLQYVDDAQTQALPTSEFEQARIASAMNFADWHQLEKALNAHRENVTREFDAVFAKVTSTQTTGTATNARQIAADALSKPAIHAVFEHIAVGKATREAIETRVSSWLSSSRTATLTPKVRALMETLIPAALRASLAEDATEKTFFRVFDLLEAIDKRATYLALLAELPSVMARVAKIAAKSAWAAELLRRHPVLLDDCISERRETRIDWPSERAKLDATCSDHAGDTERLYEILRHTKQTITLKLNIADIEGRIGVMALSDELTALADMLLDATLNLAWRTLGNDGKPDGFAIIGYGKLGSKELGYASDLDLVFLYDEKSSVPTERYAKLAQRLSSWLTTMTAGGVLYDTDLRLRPDGASGMLVSSVTAFRDYQLTRAWTWEHQALTRARWCAGDAALAAPFDSIRNEVLSQQRDRKKLGEEIIAMRNKMREEKKDRADALDLKHTRGGIVDVEFIVQYLILAYSHEHSEFLKNLGNFALLTRAGALGILDESIAANVGKAYLTYRERQHIARNNNEDKTLIGLEDFSSERRAVFAAWGALLGDAAS
jgi:glutamate-ammonia-ligase adenylyltransferase